MGSVGEKDLVDGILRRMLTYINYILDSDINWFVLQYKAIGVQNSACYKSVK